MAVIFRGRVINGKSDDQRNFIVQLLDLCEAIKSWVRRTSERGWGEIFVCLVEGGSSRYEHSLNDRSQQQFLEALSAA